jgi:hypothetical protein
MIVEKIKETTLFAGMRAERDKSKNFTIKISTKKPRFTTM